MAFLTTIFEIYAIGAFLSGFLFLIPDAKVFPRGGFSLRPNELSGDGTRIFLSHLLTPL